MRELQQQLDATHNAWIGVDTEAASRHADFPRVAAVPPIAFPDPEVFDRERMRRQAVERAKEAAATAEALRLHQAVSAARLNGRDEGHGVGWKAGYKVGTTWGIVCGALGTVLFGGVLMVGVTALIGLGRL
jgi:hypothetical protein